MANDQVNETFGSWMVEGVAVRYAPGEVRRLVAEMQEGFRRYPWGGVEMGGILLGRREGASAVVEGYRSAVCEHEYGPAFELSAGDRARLEKQLAGVKEDGLVAVGWYHSVSHRELGLTEADRKLWDSYFGEDWQVALVVKRSKSEAAVGGVYRRDGASVRHLVVAGIGEAEAEDRAPEVVSEAQAPEGVTSVEAVAAEERPSEELGAGTQASEEDGSQGAEGSDRDGEGQAPEGVDLAPAVAPEVEAEVEVPVVPVRVLIPDEVTESPVSVVPVAEEDQACEETDGAAAEPVAESVPEPAAVEAPAEDVVVAVSEHVPAVDEGGGSPFRLTPDPEFFFKSKQHIEALANLYYGIAGRKGFVMLTGESGVGKTMVMECLTDRLQEESIEYAYVFNSKVTQQELFELLAIDFELKVENAGKTAVLVALNDKLVQRARNGQVTALLIDDAQKLSMDVMEELELLGNLETRKGKLLQVVMAARPEFEKMLREPELRGFRQRFVLRARLGALTEKETGEYIAFRLSRGEGKWSEMLPSAVWPAVFRVTGGIPRLISAVCGRLLETGQVADVEAVRAVAEEFGLDE